MAALFGREAVDSFIGGPVLDSEGRPVGRIFLIAVSDRGYTVAVRLDDGGVISIMDESQILVPVEPDAARLSKRGG